MLDLVILAEAVGAAEHHVEPTAWLLTPSGWVAMSMVAVFAIMLWAGVPAIVAGALDKKIAGIRDNLDAAERLRKEAEALKAEYQSKLADSAKHADELRIAAEDEAKSIVSKAKADATALIARRTKSAEEKIAAAERAAILDLRARAANAATAAAAQLIAAGHDASADKMLVDQAITRLN